MKGKVTHMVLVDGEDLVLENRAGSSKMLDAKVRAAQLKGEIYIHPMTGKAKAPFWSGRSLNGATFTLK